MFIYKVTHVKSGEFYIGKDTRSRREFDTTQNSDPEKVFKSDISNRYGNAKMNTCSKHLIYHNSDSKEIDKFINKVLAENKTNPQFKGFYPKPETVKEVVQDVEPEDTSLIGPIITNTNTGGKNNSKKN